SSFFSFHLLASSLISPLSLHDALPISSGIRGFFVARFLLGIGEAPTFPGNAKAVGYWFPSSERSLATAIFDAAAKFASAIGVPLDRKSTRLNSSHVSISYAVFCLKKKK